MSQKIKCSRLMFSSALFIVFSQFLGNCECFDTSLLPTTWIRFSDVTCLQLAGKLKQRQHKTCRTASNRSGWSAPKFTSCMQPRIKSATSLLRAESLTTF